MTTRVFRWTLFLTVLTACDDFTRPTPGPPRPVIQALLIAGDSTHYASVTFTVSPDSVSGFSGQEPAVPPGEVDLTLVGPTGPVSHFEPVPGRPGKFRAVAVITPGASYRLVGTVAGSAVEASTIVPEPPVILEPADTVRLPASVQSRRLLQLPFRWSATGGGGCVVTMTDGRFEDGPILYRDTIATIFPTQFGIAPDMTFIAFHSYDPAAAAFFSTFDALDPVPGNITGALGVFGSGARTDQRVVVIWE